MAKRVKGATITFEVTDDGTLKQVGQRAKGAKKGLDGVSKSAGDARRNMQAMSGRTETSTKGFARMQQGTGGLVQTYAILASTLFAVGAAFRALENAANIQNQIKGFQQLAAITGTSMLSTTAAVREATGGLLEFQAAAQQVAIATAAGFSRDQIVGLAEGAKLASVALGRDMTDSYNRLIRGVTKAEPELLDELGIILRLDIATRKFAASQGLVAEKLTIAQRRMAVYNEVNQQLQENFGAFGDDADKYLNSFTRFATTISDVAKDVGGFVTRVLEPVVGFLDRSSGVLGVLLGVLAFKMLKQVVPAANDMSGALTNFANRAKQRLTDYDTQIEKTSAKIKKAGKKHITVENSVSVAFKKDLKKRGVSDKFFNMKRFQDQKAHITKYIKQLPKKTKAEKATAKKIEVMYRAAYKKIEMAQKQTLTKAGLSFKKMGLQIEKFVSLPAQKAAVYINKLGQFALKTAGMFRVLGTAASAALSILMGFMMVDFVLELVSEGYRETKEAIADLKDTNKKLTDETEESLNILAGLYKNHNKAIKDGKIEAFEAAAAIKFMGNALANLSTDEAISKMFEEMNEQIIKANSGLLNMGRAEKEAKGNLGEFFKNQIITSFTDPNAQKDVVKALQELLPDDGALQKAGFGKDAQVFELNEQTGIMNAIEAARKLLSVDKTSVEGKNALSDAIDKYSDQLFQNSGLIEQAANNTFRLTQKGQDFLDNLDDITLGSKKAGDGIIGLEQATKDLRQSIDNMLPKPSLFSNFVSGFAQIKKEIEASGLKDFKLTIGDKEYSGKDGMIQVLQQRLGLNKESAEAIANQTEELSNVFEKTDELIRKEKAYLSLLDTQKKRLMFFDTSINRRRAALLDIEKVEAQRIRALGEFNSKQEIYNKLNEKMSDTMRDALDSQLSQVEALEAQQAVLEGNLNIAKAFAAEILKAADAAGTTALKDALIGDKSNNEIREKLAKDLQSAGAGFIAGKGMELIGAGFSKIMPQKVKDLFGVGKMSKEAQEFQTVHKGHITGMASVLTQHVTGIAQVMGTKAPGPITDQSGGTGGTGTSAGDDAKKKTDEKTGQTIGGEIEDLVTKGKGTGDTGFSAMFGDMGGIFDVFLGDLKGIFKGENGLFGEGGLFANLKAGLFGGDGGGEGIFGNFMKNLTGEGGGFMKAITGAIGGGGSGGLLGGLMGGSGGGLLGGLLGGGKSGIMGLLKPLLGMIPGIGPLLSILPFAKGGVIGNKLVGLAQGGVMPRYAKGGVATQPTYLVGEGKQNEAVVPLPDNRSIPVDFGGKGMGNNNNVSISVNMAEGTSDTKSDAEDGKQLGAAINAAVLNEIERQQRPGGMLATG